MRWLKDWHFGGSSVAVSRIFIDSVLFTQPDLESCSVIVIFRPSFFGKLMN